MWKAFWGNFIGAGHIQQLGGLKDLRKMNPYTSLESLSKIAYDKGVEILTGCNCFELCRKINHQGFLITLSPSPLEWFQGETQTRREQLQKSLAPVAIGS